MSLERSTVSGTAIPIPGNEVDTDRIIPARYLKEVTFKNMGQYLFQDAKEAEDGSKKDHPLNEDKYQGASIMVVGDNFGCGSSREHAPQSIMRAGFNALIGESFAEIFAGNCKSLGMPAVTASPEDIAKVMDLVRQNPSAKLTLDLQSLTATITQDDNPTFDCPIAMNEERRQTFLSGTWDELTVLKENETLIQKTAQSLPYVSQFEE